MVTGEAEQTRRALREQLSRYPALEERRGLVESLGEEELRLLPRTALAVVTPDGLAQGTHRRLLADLGAYVIAYRFRTLTQRDAERLYQDGLITRTSGRHITAWWIKKNVFDLGEALVLLLRHPVDTSFQTTVTKSKGASDPLMARPGTYRERYRTPNKTFALMHSSDDMISLLHEAAVLFDPTPPAELLGRPYWSEDLRAAVTGYRTTVELRRMEQYRALYRLKRRLLLELAGVGAVPHGVVGQLCALYDQAGDVVEQNPGFAAETEAVDRLLAEEAALLRSLATCREPSTTEVDLAAAVALTCLRTLTTRGTVTPEVFSQMTALLSRIGIGLNQLETTLLESYFFFSPKEPE
ncbi:hypothetical protein ACH41C_32425 [Streptomyces althioticus]|uniref:hypothetical protein n=1 Tax=Streptomyces althioticus TaxID=83380 RepID=UPI0033C096FB